MDVTSDMFDLPPVREKGTELLGSLPEVGVADQYVHDNIYYPRRRRPTASRSSFSDFGSARSEGGPTSTTVFWRRQILLPGFSTFSSVQTPLLRSARDPVAKNVF